MTPTATRPHPTQEQTGQPLKAKPCQCAEPVGDIRDHLCIRCGHQVDGVPLRDGLTAFPALRDHTTRASKRPRYRGAQ